MKLINKSLKVVFVGSELLMPDHSIEIDDQILDTPGVQALLKTVPPILEIDNSAEKAAEAARAEEEMRAKIAAEERAKIEAELKAKAENAEADVSTETKEEAPAEEKAEKEEKKTAEKPSSKPSKSSKSNAKK